MIQNFAIYIGIFVVIVALISVFRKNDDDEPM